MKIKKSINLKNELEKLIQIQSFRERLNGYKKILFSITEQGEMTNVENDLLLIEKEFKETLNGTLNIMQGIITDRLISMGVNVEKLA